MKLYLSAHIISMLILSSALFAGCSSDDGGDVKDNPLIPIGLSSSEVQVSANLNKFSIKFLKAAVATEEPEKNTAVSPLGLAVVAGMFGNAIAPEDRTELLNVLGINDINALNSYCTKMLQTLPTQDNTATLLLNSGSWFNNQRVILDESYRNILEKDYSSKITLADFNQPSTLTDINAWVSDCTKGLIPKILSEDDLNPSTLAVWINSIYFKGQWASKFNKSKTKADSFTKHNGEVVTVDMMTHEDDNIYTFLSAQPKDPSAKDPKYPDEYILTGYTTMDYGNKAFALTAILPDESVSIDDFIKNLPDNFWDDIVNVKSKRGGSELRFPKLSLSVSKRLENTMKTLGCKKIFEKVNMPGLGEDEAAITVLKQDTRLDIDEAGAELAVVTVAKGDIMVNMSHKTYPVVFNRPFLYFIWEKSTGTILLAGTVMNPTE